MTCRHGHEHCPVCAGVNGPTPPVATAPIGFTPSVDPHCAPISKTEYEALTAENTALKQRITELEAWQLAIAEGTGFCNRAEGQSGYEVADPQTILDHFQGLEFTALTLADDVVTASRASEARLREYLDSAISSLESNLVYLEAHVQASRLRQGSKRIATCADAALEGHKQNIGFLKAALNSTPAADLAAHDERVKREVVEKIVKAIKEDGSPWSDADTAKLCEKSGISPSTETPTQEPKP